MSESKHPELHINEEPSNDFIDVGVGMAASTILFLAIGVVFTVIEIITR
jgi:hypothetical protein